MQILTKLLTSGQSFTLTSDYKALNISFQLSAGASDAGSYSGSIRDPVTKDASTTNPLAPGQGRVFVDSQIITGIVITCTTGTISIDIGYS